MRKSLFVLLSLPLFTASLLAQAASTPPTQGAGLPVISQVSTSITIDAVLLPKSVTRRVFGNEIASKYAAVSITTSNHDPKQSLIIQSVLLDYSHWLFSGNFAALAASDALDTDSSQQANKRNQVASVEVRIVRGQMQDAQLWSFRNWVIRSAVAAGTVAGGLSFASASSNFTNSVTAYTADFIPALTALWPDNTQAHSDLISDIGFRTNHVIPAQSSDIVVAFFPLDRFLTSDLKKLYLDEPAAFFNPSELLLSTGKATSITAKNRTKLLNILASAALVTKADETGTQEVVKAVMNYEAAYKAANPVATTTPVNPCTKAVEEDPKLPSMTLTTKQCMVVDVLNRVSLNNIHVVVGGVMSIDTNAVPALLTGVSIDSDTKAATWTVAAAATPAAISATISGSFLSGGTVAIAGTAPDGTAIPATSITSITNTTVKDSSLAFTFKLAAGTTIATGSKLSFTVTKKSQDGTITTSAPFVYPVPASVATP